MIEDAIFHASETHGRALRTANRLISHSPDAGWRSLYAAIFEEAPLSTDEPAVGHPSLIYHISRPTEVVRQITGERRERTLIGPRRFCLTPGESRTRWEHAGHPEILQVYLRKSAFESAAEEMFGFDASRVEIVPRFAVVDPLLEQLALAIMAALRDGAADERLYVETMAQMIAVHLLRLHSTRARSTPTIATDGLTRQRIRRLLEYIDANLSGDLSLESMAAEVDISPCYLSHVFKDAIGETPHQYVLSRRIELAKDMLRDTGLPIAEVALSAGFSSQSHLSTWFRRMVGVSPGAYRRDS